MGEVYVCACVCVCVCVCVVEGGQGGKWRKNDLERNW